MSVDISKSRNNKFRKLIAEIIDVAYLQIT